MAAVQTWTTPEIPAAESGLKTPPTPRPRINFPQYDGKSDPLPWLNKCDTYFRGMSTWEDEKVWQASLHLEGVAAEWFYTLERDIGGVLTWLRFSEFLHMRFGPPLWTNSMADLKELYRTDTVEEYQREFLRLLCRCDDVSQQQQTNMFTAGLGDRSALTLSWRGHPTFSMPSTWPGRMSDAWAPHLAPARHHTRQAGCASVDSPPTR